MARENQGLQYALIAFVLLTIILGVTTFIFFRQYQQMTIKADANETEAKRQEGIARLAMADAENLKTMMGFAPGDSLDTIQAEFNKDMLAYAGDYPEDRFYHRAIARLGKDLADARKSLNNELATVKDLKSKLVELNAVTEKRIEPFKVSADRAAKEKDAEAARFATDRDRMKTDMTQLDKDLKQTRQDFNAQNTELKTEITSLGTDLKEALDALATRNKIIQDITDPNPDRFLGEVRWVNQQQRLVWINLGEADALPPQTTFGVFPAGAHDMAETDQKAKIEVTRILGAHLAEARILEDRLTEPILRGDKLFTAVWTIGEKRHFALAGIFDLDNNGQSDRDLLQTLIESNGGAVDAKQDANGVRQGALDANTRYLILGERPGETASEEEHKDYLDICNAAKKLKIETIAVETFLDRMGWANQVRVLTYGRGGGRSFPVPPDPVPRVSGNKISDLFKPREPPRSSGGSTF
ncbi:MAG: hypothetical protein JW809_11995 [Pirellulales bacterium]|nr:hypothetical protein [Pirellulales bacterium]